MTGDEKIDDVHEAELKYQDSCYESELLAKVEEVRRVKMDGQLVRAENAEAHEQALSKDTCIKTLSRENDEIRAQLQLSLQTNQQQEQKLRLQTRETADLKEKLSILNSLAQDSTKVLSEKLVLTRELAILRPEIELIRTQLANQTELLSEKLALERQLNALEVELANEKRAAQRAAQKRARDDESNDDLRRLLHETEEQLAKYKRVTQRTLESQNKKAAEDKEELFELGEKLALAEKQLAQERRAAQNFVQEKADEHATVTKELELVRAKLEEALNELDAEKQAVARVAAAEKSIETVESEKGLEELKQELAESKKALAGEKKLNDRRRREGEKALERAEVRRKSVQDKLGDMRKTLAETKAELKRCQAELQHALTRTATTTSVPIKKAAGASSSRKTRQGSRISGEEGPFLTPDKKEELPKRNMKKVSEPTIVGDKSTFSITPFLSKTMAVTGGVSEVSASNETAPRLPVFQFRGLDEVTTEVAAVPDAELADPAVPEKPQASRSKAKMTRGISAGTVARAKRTEKKKALAESSSSNTNQKAQEDCLSEPALETVVEEEANDHCGDATTNVQENQAPVPVVCKRKAPAARPKTAATAVAKAPEPKAKKRKLLNGHSSVFFDNEDGDADTSVKTKPKRGSLARLATMKGAGGLGIATFSPLKRDRRGVNASFLAS